MVVVLLGSGEEEVRDVALPNIGSGFRGGHETALVFVLDIFHFLDSLHAHFHLVVVRSVHVTVTSHNSMEEVLLLPPPIHIAGYIRRVKVGGYFPHSFSESKSDGSNLPSNEAIATEIILCAPDEVSTWFQFVPLGDVIFLELVDTFSGHLANLRSLAFAFGDFLVSLVAVRVCSVVNNFVSPYFQLLFFSFLLFSFILLLVITYLQRFYDHRPFEGSELAITTAFNLLVKGFAGVFAFCGVILPSEFKGIVLAAWLFSSGSNTVGAVRPLVLVVPGLVVDSIGTGSLHVLMVAVSSFLSEEHVVVRVVASLFGLCMSSQQALFLAVASLISHRTGHV